MIAICPNPYRDANLDYTRRAMRMITEEGIECTICPVFAEDGEDILPHDLNYSTVEELGDDCTLLIVIGGDGTILSVVRSLHGRSVPVLGVNLGTKGFMTALEAEDFEYIRSAVRGDYRLSERMMLDIAIERGGKVIYTDQALNDAVIHGYGECINITAYCSDDRMIAYSGDGVIVATPTGSTGYSMSAGGPIVEPEAEGFILTPICAHAIGAKPFVVGAQKQISVTTEKLHTRRAYLSVDGNPVLDLSSGDRMIIRRSEHRTLMARVREKSFFETAYEKL
ncbi:MAG: NAD(+)/NADH kinase [Oscillospiraceae bacterium]|nr:NAD(+)/NADH kinase [Oscillospiraceae bacterium]